jgi:prevent-host-death family protein
MKEISIQELQDDTGQWVRLAARQERIIITDGGRPVAALTAYRSAQPPKRLPDREANIKQRSLIKVDSAEYVSDLRG